MMMKQLLLSCPVYSVTRVTGTEDNGVNISCEGLLVYAG